MPRRAEKSGRKLALETMSRVCCWLWSWKVSKLVILAKLVMFGEPGEFLVILVSLAKLIDTGESGEPGDSFGHCLHSRLPCYVFCICMLT